MSLAGYSADQNHVQFSVYVCFKFLNDELIDSLAYIIADSNYLTLI